jgi:hypothetical protein
MTSNESREKQDEHLLVRSRKAAVNISEEDRAKANKACLSTSRKSLTKTPEPTKNATPPPMVAPPEEHFVIDINTQHTEIIGSPSSSEASRQTFVVEEMERSRQSSRIARTRRREEYRSSRSDDNKATERSSLTDRRGDKGCRTQNRDGRDKLEGDAKSQRKRRHASNP